MGAPKQRWTPEEEAALIAGIQKYGVGKWSTILKDQEFSAALRSRSNVDLKDKWRNVNCMANGMGSRHKTKVLPKSSHSGIKQDDDVEVDAMLVHKDSEVVDSVPVVEYIETPITGSETKITSLEDLILEAIAKLKEPRGSNQRVIAQYVEKHHPSPDLERNLTASLKFLTENGRLMKVKNQYRITPKSASFESKDPHPPMMVSEEAMNGIPGIQKTGIIFLTKSHIDAELEKMRNMTAEEAAAAAARAVKEAEAAIAEAEVAAREAEEAEAEAEAARCFAAAAMKTLSRETILV